MLALEVQGIVEMLVVLPARHVLMGCTVPRYAVAEAETVAALDASNDGL